MKIDINLDENTFTSHITFFRSEFKEDRDYNLATAIVTTFSADYNLDPELEKEDFFNIFNACEEKGVMQFTFEISEDGIEVEV